MTYDSKQDIIQLIDDMILHIQDIMDTNHHYNVGDRRTENIKNKGKIEGLKELRTILVKS